MQNHRTSIFLTRIFIDYIILSVVFFSSAYLSNLDFNEIFSINIIFIYTLTLIIWYFASFTFGLYDEFRGRDLSFEIISLLKTIYILVITTIVIVFFLKEVKLSRYFIFIYTVGLFSLLALEKVLFRKSLYKLRKKNRNLRSLLIVGAGSVGKKFFEDVENNPLFGYRVIGFLDDVNKKYLNGNYLGKIENLENVLTKNEVDTVIVTLPNYAEEKLEEVINICNKLAVNVKIIPDYFRFFASKYSVTMFGPFPVISVREDKINLFHWRLLKRAFDTSFSLLLFVFVFSWLWPIIAIAIKLDSKGPVFFKQERWGRNNKKFLAYKFRSMRADAKDIDEKGNYLQATKNDPRITRVGKVLRKTNLDELPQFINVLKGEMSIVGPRPHPEKLNLDSKRQIDLYMQRHLVKPGITGWAQVNGYRGETKQLYQMKKRVEYDIWYIENWSFMLDIQIILRTIVNMLRGDPNAY